MDFLFLEIVKIRHYISKKKKKFLLKVKYDLTDLPV
jgi:hypothetical protein